MEHEQQDMRRRQVAVRLGVSDETVDRLMAMVPREERAAASSVTNVPRSLAAALSPLLSGLLLDRTSFGWPLLCAGALKAAYDLLLFRQFAHLRPEEEPERR